MRTLYLHIGHGKTGSSYIQSSLVLSRDALAAQGIAYPPYKTDAAAAAGGMSSGNGKPLFQALESGWRAALLAWRLARIEGNVLLSSELLLRYLEKPGAVAAVILRSRPLRIELQQRLLRGPVTIGHHGDRVFQLDHAVDTRLGNHFRGVDADKRRAKHRRRANRIGLSGLSANRGHRIDPLGVRNCVCLHRQHPIHHYDDPNHCEFVRKPFT